MFEYTIFVDLISLITRLIGLQDLNICGAKLNIINSDDREYHGCVSAIGNCILKCQKVNAK